MTVNDRVYSFKDARELDPLLHRVVREHPTDYADKSDLLRKAVHFLLKTNGYEWPMTGKPVDAQAPKGEGESL